MAKLFAPLGITAKGNILPLDKTELCLNENKTIDCNRIQPLIEDAERIIDKPIEALTASLFRELFKSGDRAKYETKLYQRRHDLLRLFLAEYYERKGRFVEKIVDLAWAMMEESTWAQPASYQNNNAYGKEFTLPASFGPDRLHGIELVTGTTAGVLSLVYFYLKEELDAISPVIREKIKYMIHERVTVPWLHCNFIWEGNGRVKTDNWAPWISSNILVAVALTEENMYVRERTLQKCLNTIDNFVDTYGPDGSCDEGSSYWSHAGGALFDCLELLYDISGGKIDLFKEALVKKIGEFICKVNINGCNYVNFADAWPNAYHNGHFLYRYGKKCGSEQLMSFGKIQADIDNSLPDSAHPVRAFRNLLLNAEATGELNIPKNSYLSDIKIMISREIPKTDEGMYLAIKGGHNAERHNHNDIGSFIVYKNAKPVLIDPGAGQYIQKTFGALRYTLWHTQSHYHNLPAFDGIGQRNGADFSSSDEIYNAEAGSISMELKNAYEKDAGIVSYRRYADMTDGVISIVEDIQLENEKEIDFRLISPVKPTINGDGTIALNEGVVLTYPSSLSAEIEEFEPTLVDAWGERLYRIHLKTNAKECSLSFTIR